MQPEIDELETIGQTLTHEPGTRARQHDLAPVRRGGDARVARFTADPK